ncbi:ubiquitin-like domain-containing protein [Paenibacillus glufosinatiresistens]|uniref:ubiquitin-like domain-containing protein n=1 Tax=Paenibacillus glufosinatiresistens TaxID=3070657 RepID=UPI00286E3575|nr:ubiquitin-like domain-containing protein [Paenibacillus sp. YX.27]
MGAIQPEMTHDSQTSSRPNAVQWIQSHIRILLLAGAASAAVVLLIVFLTGGSSIKQITVVVDGEIRTLETRKTLLGDILAEAGITVSPHDQLSASVSDELKNGDRIAIDRAHQISLTEGGKTKTVYTTEDHLGTALTKLGVNLGEHDKVFPSTDTAISANRLDVKVVRITKQVVQRTQNLPFRVIKTADPSLYVGDVRVAQAGKPGVMIQHIEKTYQDGQLASMVMVGKEVQTVTKDKVIAVGTKAKPIPKPAVAAKAKATTTKAKTTSSGGTAKKSGVNFDYKRVIKNVSMTAYSSEEPGIGTRTASGTRVTEGRTIAVDPNIIPIGWWVYIEGLGFRRAEDTGGAIKGNKIDVYYDSLSHARNFGRKSRTVYVIGPVKPELN